MDRVARFDDCLVDGDMQPLVTQCRVPGSIARLQPVRQCCDIVDVIGQLDLFITDAKCFTQTGKVQQLDHGRCAPSAARARHEAHDLLWFLIEFMAFRFQGDGMLHGIQQLRIADAGA